VIQLAQYVASMTAEGTARLAVLGPTTAPVLRHTADSLQCISLELPEITAGYGHELLQDLERAVRSQRVSFFLFSGTTERSAIRTLLSSLHYFLDDSAVVVVDNADFSGVYAGIRESLLSVPGYRLLDIVLDSSPAARPGQGLAVLRFEQQYQRPQDAADIPESKHKRLDDGFAVAQPMRDRDWATQTVVSAVARWTPRDGAQSRRVHDELARAFPDDQSPQTYWHDAWRLGFKDFFSWGHDQDFGSGLQRKGTMSTRHVEILAECLEYGYLDGDLQEREVLDVGCWTGGDVLALAGLGARVTAIEEHPVSARAATALCQLLNVPAAIIQRSLYQEEPAWQSRFDVVYLSGVVYHVTDPVLALRICYSYLKPAGRLIVETKACHLEGPYCEYSGTLEKGWNWYAPTFETLGRWLVDAGFPKDAVAVHRRPLGRLLACAVKSQAEVLPDAAGFSRPGSWLEGPV
jgi:2-polyprenyl-3-methyl-5-hydroxy-6-metoxy-1,4-benzoquinol methylase